MNLRCLIFGHDFEIQEYNYLEGTVLTPRCKKCFEQPSNKLLQSWLKDIKRLK